VCCHTCPLTVHPCCYEKETGQKVGVAGSCQLQLKACDADSAMFCIPICCSSATPVHTDGPH
jgi:hypothetical protein